MFEDNEPCEICEAHQEIDYSMQTFDVYMINPHCREIRKSRKNRHNKNTKPTITYF